MSLVILFIKAPEYGQVKTRLATCVGNGLALSLYRRFVETTLARLAPFGPLRIAYTPANRKALIKSWLRGNHELRAQRGDDLGKRMGNALAEAFSDGHDKAVILGGDIPDLPVGLIHEAFQALDLSDTVFVPTSDGGYCLVGARRGVRLAPIFEGMRWSHGQVMAETVSRAESHGISLQCLAAWHDIDTPEDFLAFVKRNQKRAGLPRLYREAARIISGGEGCPHGDGHGRAGAGEVPHP